MAVLKFASEDWNDVYPLLTEVWPRNGQWDEERLTALRTVVKIHGAPNPPDPVLVDMDISLEQLTKHGERLATSYSTPWKYQKYFNPHVPINNQALRLKPGSRVSLTIEGVPTNGIIGTIRRVTYQGDPNYVKSEITWATKNIPLYLDRETKCTCKYCGTPPASDETECRKCGAPLPSENC